MRKETPEERLRDYEERLLEKPDYLYYAIQKDLRDKRFSRDEIESFVAALISKNKSKLPSSVWEKLNSTNKAWNNFCQSFGRDSQGDTQFIPSSSNFDLKGIAGNRTLKGVLMLPCGQDITISKYGKKLAKGIVNMQNMVEMWANTRPEILSVVSCEVGDEGIFHEDYAAYIAIEVYVECDLLVYFD